MAVKSKRTNKSKNGFAVILLDIIFVVFGIYFLILGLIQSRDTLASVIDAIIK